MSFYCSALYLFGTFTVLGTHGPGVLIPYISLVFQIQVQVLRSEFVGRLRDGEDLYLLYFVFD